MRLWNFFVSGPEVANFVPIGGAVAVDCLLLQFLISQFVSEIFVVKL